MKTLCFTGIAALVSAAVFLGCGSHDQSADTGGGHSMEKMHHDMQHEAASATEVAGAVAVSAADKGLMKAQGTCPVSGEELASQEAPVKLDYKGKTVFLCCKDCVAQFKKNPAKYAAKLKH